MPRKKYWSWPGLLDPNYVARPTFIDPDRPEPQAEWQPPEYVTPEQIYQRLTEGKRRRAARYVRSGLRGLQEFLRAPTPIDAIEAVSFAFFDDLMDLADSYRHYLIQGTLPIPTVNRRLATFRALLKILKPDEYSSFWKVFAMDIDEENRRNWHALRAEGRLEGEAIQIEIFTSGTWADEQLWPWAAGCKERDQQAYVEQLERQFREEEGLQAERGDPDRELPILPNPVPNTLNTVVDDLDALGLLKDRDTNKSDRSPLRLLPKAEEPGVSLKASA